MVDYSASLRCVCVLLCLFVQRVDSTVPEYYVDEHCSQTISLNYGSVEAVRLRLTKTLTYPDGMRCAMRIQAPEGKKLVVRIEAINIIGTQNSSCRDGDFLQIFDGPSESAIAHPDMPSFLCSKPNVGHFSTSGRYLVLRFISNTDRLTGTGAKLTVTAYSETPCSQDEFRCKTSAHCIKSSLRCNEHPSCPDGTDESMPDCLSTAAIVGITVGCVVVFAAVVIAIVVFCVLRERRKRARIIKRAVEHQRSLPTYANSLWLNSSQPEIDLSQIDPIWDGSDTSRQSSFTGKKDSTIWGLDIEIDPRYDSCSAANEQDNGDNKRKLADETDNKKADDKGFEAPVQYSHVDKMKKVPSSFWDIDNTCYNNGAAKITKPDSRQSGTTTNTLPRQQEISTILLPASRGSTMRSISSFQEVPKHSSLRNGHVLPETQLSNQCLSADSTLPRCQQQTQSGFDNQFFTMKRGASRQILPTQYTYDNPCPVSSHQISCKHLEPSNQFLSVQAGNVSPQLENSNSNSLTEPETSNECASSQLGTSYQCLWTMDGPGNLPSSQCFITTCEASQDQQMTQSHPWKLESGHQYMS